MTATPFAPSAAQAVEPAPPSTVQVNWSAPRVNLLPLEVVVARRVRRAQRGAALAAAGAAALVGCVWALGLGSTAHQQQRLDEATARLTALQAEQAQYAAAPQVLKQLETVRDTRAQAMAQDVAWYSYVDSLTRALPATAWLVSVQTSLSAAGSAAAPATTGGTGTAGTSSVGSVTISARSTSYDDVAAYLDALAAVPGVADVFLSTSTSDASGSAPVISFTVTASVTDAALTHRFDAKES
ncbi:PilN domain-containing protein [Streptomyces sp. NP160]|uniref:PilN domain-containing protein n=1 Tax=Streptomyces sp. NP160 TaxID=2586637 RepID=UPI0011182C4D|nr:PilN domain-containing protein [Streptomyces sp. NP160]TNM64500.1 PilN domain-containing protein [Streptomyces sp. NP160]